MLKYSASIVFIIIFLEHCEAFAGIKTATSSIRKPCVQTDTKMIRRIPQASNGIHNNYRINVCNSCSRSYTPPPPFQHRQMRMQLNDYTSLVTTMTDTLPIIAQSIFRYNGGVPFPHSFALNAVLFVGLQSKLMKILTPAGFFHALALGSGLWATLGWRGWTTCVLYLCLGSLVTKVKFQEKEKLGIAEGRGGRRGPENVWGSALTGLICAFLFSLGPSFLGISSDKYVLGYVASLATKLSDTFASEIGKAFGNATYLITTFDRVPPGTEGAVSIEGTAASILGGTLISMYGLSVGLIAMKAIPISIIAAFVATNFESVLGATLQGKKNVEWMTNEVVNFINTLIGATIAVLGGIILL